ncbi:ABC transporter permease [Rhodococcoides yunnanense]|jgi:NitT/TauT family transport system permease protein|uniref:ABC transporter permease n=1 Tax=Rhodococcoides yunnanense TaxID=278209 RepID=UPI0022B1C74F|nr:ABC transporter permease subunit [Rhodococcus yunnanensis]MCZ4277212.1 ABC transporter permease subunit [Rhodococcus yunnanensis]
MKTWLPPVVFGVLLLALWQLVTVVGGVPSFLLPSPVSIAEQFAGNFANITSASMATGTNALIGLIAGAAVGSAAAAAAVRLSIVDEMMSPIAAGAAAIPIVALAPIFNSMFSATTDFPRRLVVAIVVFFPVFVSTTKGLRQVSAVHLDLMRACAASPWQTTRLVRIPSSLPLVFTGLRVAAPNAVIAAIITEYFGGLQNGLGSRIISAAANTAYPRAWAYVLGAIVVGLLFFLLVLLLERIVTRRPALPISRQAFTV